MSSKPTAQSPQPTAQERNELYPIFLKLHNLSVLIVGGGNVGLEKLSFLLKSSPNAKVEVVAPRFISELVTLAESHPTVKLTKKRFKKKMLKKRHMVIACTDVLKVNKRVYDLSRKRYLI
ncbi:precorrin-2 dehydrogenase/sirohydrochlorin ferrochelatase family protein, partial [Flavobacterium sp.]|uniref:precorrin-2 dehydrogenase/sirohydrochlorin ferrochelatase family protein n=1 Tax=Flavobacterium sp. TaxID=239 RepID=UPI003C491DDC